MHTYIKFYITILTSVVAAKYFLYYLVEYPNSIETATNYRLNGIISKINGILKTTSAQLRFLYLTQK